MNYLNNRYLDASTGTFLSVDPLVASTGTPYLYGNGNPVTYSDPEGLEAGSWLNGSYQYAAWQRNRGRTGAQLSKRNEELKGACFAGCGQDTEALIMHEENLLLANRRPGDNWYTGSETGEKILFGFLGGGLTAGIAPAVAGAVGTASLRVAVSFPRLTSLLIGGAQLGRDLADDNPGAPSSVGTVAVIGDLDDVAQLAGLRGVRRFIV